MNYQNNELYEYAFQFMTLNLVSWGTDLTLEFEWISGFGNGMSSNATSGQL